MSNQPLAGYGERFIAYVIDIIILVLISFVIGFVIGLVLPSLRGVGSLLGLVIDFGDFFYYWSMKDGQTIGNSVMHIKVVKADGSPITAVTVLLRRIGYSINSLVFMLGWLFPLVDSQKRGFHDVIAGTLVVKA